MVMDGGSGGDDRDESRSESSRAILSGVVALVAVAVSVGLVLAGVAVGLTSFLGVGGGDGDERAGERESQSLFLPRPEKTDETGPETTLATDGSTPTDDTTSPTESESDDELEISLQAGQTEVGSYDPIDLTGVYTGGEGAILQVQKREAGDWTDFPVTIPVSDEQFATYVQTTSTGATQWRVIDTDTGVTSNPVKVTITG